MHGPNRLSDDEAFRLTRLIRFKVTRRMGRSPWRAHEREDLIQQTLLRVLGAPRHVDPTRPGFSNYLDRMIVSTLVDGHRRDRAAKRAHGSGTRSLQEPAPTDGGRECELLDTISADQQERARGKISRPRRELVDLRLDVDAAIETLSPDERRLCERLKHQSVAEVAAAEDVARGTLYRRLRKMLKRFEDAGLREYCE